MIIARGSLEEVKYQLFLSKDLGYLSNDKYQELEQLTDNVGKLLGGLIKTVSSDSNW